MIRLEKRTSTSMAYQVFSPVFSILCAFAFGAVFLRVSGFDPVDVYVRMLTGAFGDLYGWAETLVKAIPIMLCALGVSVAFRMLLWNIGAEGQLYMGAFGASWVALSLPEAPAVILLPLMVAAGMAAGALWALVAAIPRAFLRVNEIITTLMLNYVAIYWVEYLIYGPFRDPSAYNFPLSVPFAGAARLPVIGDTRIHAGIFFAILAAALLVFVLGKTRWGYEMKVLGDSPEVGRYAGINVRLHIVVALCMSGALAGLAGMSEVSAIAGRLQHGLSPGYGYTAIIVACLARLNPWGIIIVSILFGGLLVGGYSAQFIGVPAAAVNMLQGAMLFFVLVAEFLGRYRLSLGGSAVEEVG